ncbi:MAG: hypothetical protein IJ634_07550 [Bacteroidales bacterium]|nr:hypothetical protein [Bacteroidales bacterium]
MKTNNHPPELDELLASFEHAGRDARRREELGAMIDRLSETEPRERKVENERRRRVVPLWLPRLAAVACLLFFILTAVRIWIMPIDGGAAGPMVAQADPVTAVPGPTTTVLGDTLSSSSPKLGEGDHRDSGGGGVCRPQRPAVAVVAEEIAVSEAVELPEPDPEPATIVEEPLLAEEIPAIVPEPEPIAFPEPPALAQTTPAPQEEAPQPRRTSFWRSLFSPVEPDEMNGTTLAIRIL